MNKLNYRKMTQNLGKKTQRITALLAVVLLLASGFALLPASAAEYTDNYIVQKGDSLWKIAVKYQVGLSEIIAANPQFENPALIYPNDKVYVPLNDKTVLSFEEQVIALVNQERAAIGLAPLAANWELSRIARYKSQDMHDKNYFSHTSPTYGSPFDMIKNFALSYRAAGENIAKGQTTPQQVMNAWMNSPGHRANILNASFKEIGVGYVASGHYWTQMFIG
ncbi:MAG: SafA/ExsA family spore coat assembly protein [Oscillospiraceae bacterium]|jgi:uncharacterized YkwD family protein/spore coat assembly protein SafA|nr:SafA/ExsA family spore coat assembly protein [Oscillospiraceae bacterium]